MRAGWRMLLGAMAVWSAHFGLLWTASSIFGSGAIARVIALVLTILALAAVAALALLVSRLRPDDAFDGWMRTMGLLGCAIAFLSIIWQAAPAAIS